MLQTNPKYRIQSIKEIRAHPFFMDKPIIPKHLPTHVFDRPLNYQELLEINENFIIENL